MIELAILGGLIGVGGFYAIIRHTNKDPKKNPTSKPEHEHVWNPWENYKREDLTGENYAGRTAIIGLVTSQERTCVTCGYTQYEQRTIKN